MRVSPLPVLRGIGTTYVNIVRNTPLTLVIVFCGLGLGLVLDVSFSDEPVHELALAVHHRPVRLHGGVRLRGDPGRDQHGAGRPGGGGPRLGLTFRQNLRLIVLPQAFRAVIAPLGSVLIALIKNTTIAAAIGVGEAVPDDEDAVRVARGRGRPDLLRVRAGF